MAREARSEFYRLSGDVQLYGKNAGGHKPAFSSNKSPMLVLDTQGLLYAGASDLAPLSNMPETLGASLRQSYPALWRDMSMSNFGQFHGEEATFVYLKIELTAQPETHREYFYSPMCATQT